MSYNSGPGEETQVSAAPGLLQFWNHTLLPHLFRRPPLLLTSLLHLPEKFPGIEHKPSHSGNFGPLPYPPFPSHLFPVRRGLFLSLDCLSSSLGRGRDSCLQSHCANSSPSFPWRINHTLALSTLPFSYMHPDISSSDSRIFSVMWGDT